MYVYTKVFRRKNDPMNFQEKNATFPAKIVIIALTNPTFDPWICTYLCMYTFGIVCMYLEY
jgi:flagellar biosynthesis protein FliQ